MYRAVLQGGQGGRDSCVGTMCCPARCTRRVCRPAIRATPLLAAHHTADQRMKWSIPKPATTTDGSTNKLQLHGCRPAHLAREMRPPSTPLWQNSYHTLMASFMGSPRARTWTEEGREWWGTKGD